MTTIENVNTLVKIRDDEKAPHGVRVTAACALLDRAYGRPAQTIDATINSTIIRAELSPVDDINRRLAAIAERLREDQVPKQISN